MKAAVRAIAGLALCAVALAHPAALACGDKDMKLKGTIMGLTSARPRASRL